MEFTKEELNALGLIVNAAAITGKDAEFIVELKRKIAAMIAEIDTPIVEKCDTPS